MNDEKMEDMEIDVKTYHYVFGNMYSPAADAPGVDGVTPDVNGYFNIEKEMTEHEILRAIELSIEKNKELNNKKKLHILDSARINIDEIHRSHRELFLQSIEKHETRGFLGIFGHIFNTEDGIKKIHCGVKINNFYEESLRIIYPEPVSTGEVMTKKQVLEEIANFISAEKINVHEKSGLLVGARQTVDRIYSEYIKRFKLANNIHDPVRVLSVNDAPEDWDNCTLTPLDCGIVIAHGCDTAKVLNYSLEIDDKRMNDYRFIHPGIRAEILFNAALESEALAIFSEYPEAVEYALSLQYKYFGVSEKLEEFKHLAKIARAKNEALDILAEMGF